MLRAAQITWKTDTGRQRRENEDSAFARAPVFVVADGMGGAQAGEVASRMAVEVFAHELPPDGSAEERLASSVRAANRRIYDVSRSEPALEGMGTTLTAVYVGDTDLAVAHVGDSRAYLFRDGQLQRLTQDHSLVEELVRRGKLTEEQAAEHPQRSIITRALGIDAEVEVDTWTYPARPGDVILLCSDGLTSMIGEDQIVAVLGQAPDLDQAGERLIDAANGAGGRDNITVVLLALEEAGGDVAVDQPTVVGLQPAPGLGPHGDPGLSHAGAPGPGDPEPGTGQAKASARAPGATMTAPASPAQPRTGLPLARTQGRSEPPVPRSRRRGRRRFVKPLAALLSAAIVAGLIGAGGYLATRELFFVGTTPQGVVAVYSGLPYDLPLGIHLYEQVYVSGMPIQFVPASRRAALLNHQLRSQADAISLVRAAELGQLSR